MGGNLSRWYSVIEHVGDITFREALLDQLPPKSVLLRIAYCGICATDIAILDGKRRKPFPYSPGHEYTGTIECVGTQVSDFVPGDSVVGNPNFVCEACYFCQRGEYHLCSCADVPHYSNGAFANSMVIDSHYIYRLPSQLNLRDATLTECLACIAHAVEHISGPQKVILVIGAGTMGLLVTEVLRHLKQAEVIIVSELSAARRKVAGTLGADITVEGDLYRLQQVIQSLHPIGVDVVFECAGSITAIDNALQCVRRGGKVILVGRTDEEAILPLHPCKLARNSLSLVGTSRYLPRHFEQALAWLSEGIITTEAYFDRIFELRDLAQAFQYVREGCGIKTLVRGD